MNPMAKPAPSFTLRWARKDDLPFLRAMLYEAACWRPEVNHPPMDEVLGRNGLENLLDAWGDRPGDTGVVAETLDSNALGAAWYRYWDASNHSYGYVADDVPEVAIAVVRGYRRCGFGRALLAELIARASSDGVGRISLSVEFENPAHYLYRSLGFHEVGELGTAWTMVRDIV